MIIEPLAQQSRKGFACGNSQLDDWIQKYAGQNERQDFSRTYLAIDGGHLLGFVALSAASVSRHIAPVELTRNAPEYVPMVAITRLAVDRRAQGHGLGTLLLGFALDKILTVAGMIGAHGTLISAVDDNAKAFYLSHARFLEFDSLPGWLALPTDYVRREFTRTT